MRKSTHDRRTTVESGTLNPTIRPHVNTRLQLQVNFIYFNTKLVAYPTNDYNMLTYIERPATGFNIAGSGLPRRVIVGESKDGSLSFLPTTPYRLSHAFNITTDPYFLALSCVCGLPVVAVSRI